MSKPLIIVRPLVYLDENGNRHMTVNPVIVWGHLHD